MTTFNLKLENDFKKKAHEFADTIGVSLSSLIKMLLRDSMRRQRLDISTKPRYHGEPEEGDLVFEDPRKAIEYFDKLADENGTIA